MHDHNALPRRLRRNATPAEQLLWERLRDRRLDGAKFRRQRPIGRFVVDFACVEARLIVELEGGIHRLRELDDAARLRAIEAEGWRVIVFTNEAVFMNLSGVLDAIREAVAHVPSP